MTQRFDHSKVNVVNACSPSPTCDCCGSFDHLIVNYQVGNPFAPSSSDQVAYVKNFQPKPNHDLFFTRYNIRWKHHLNFSYRNDPLPFPTLMLGLHLPDFKDPTFHHHLHKSLTLTLCWKECFWYNKSKMSTLSS